MRRGAPVDETLIWTHMCGAVVVRPAARGAMWCPRCGAAGQQWWRAVYTSKPALVRAARRGRWRAHGRRLTPRAAESFRLVVIMVGLVMWAWLFLLIWKVVAASVA